MPKFKIGDYVNYLHDNEMAKAYNQPNGRRIDKIDSSFYWFENDSSIRIINADTIGHANELVLVHRKNPIKTTTIVKRDIIDGDYDHISIHKEVVFCSHLKTAEQIEETIKVLTEIAEVMRENEIK